MRVYGKKKPPKKIGLALGSGSARGWAHIGVVQALEESGIRVDCVAGTSIGALVGAVYASGRIDALKAVVLGLDRKQILRLFDIVFPKSGLIHGKKVADFLRSYVQTGNIEQLPVPFSTVSTDLVTGSEVVGQEGNVIEAVRASISFPGIFTPVIRNGMVLVDGGLVNPVPVSVVRDMGADFVIAVDLNHDIVGTKIKKIKRASARSAGRETGQPSAEKTKMLDALSKRVGILDRLGLAQARQWDAKDPLPNIFEVLLTSISIMENQITATKLKADPPSLLIRPNLGHIRFLEFNRAREAITEGYRETRSQLGALITKGVPLGHP